MPICFPLMEHSIEYTNMQTVTQPGQWDRKMQRVHFERLFSLSSINAELCVKPSSCEVRFMSGQSPVSCILRLPLFSP